jgi:hypothetical protein
MGEVEKMKEEMGGRVCVDRVRMDRLKKRVNWNLEVG